MYLARAYLFIGYIGGVENNTPNHLSAGGKLSIVPYRKRPDTWRKKGAGALARGEDGTKEPDAALCVDDIAGGLI